jgi:NAD(P)-dependent dehydrogenase (short-subunit alcohol dehydrogenase family)
MLPKIGAGHRNDQSKRRARRCTYTDRNIPAGRFGEPHEAAALIAFLASELASYITGVTVPVDGGALRFTL